MTTKLNLYNDAAVALSQERLSSIAEDVLVKRELDQVYDETLLEALEMGLWLWSLRVVQLSYDPSIDTSTFGGYAYGFTLPSDFVRVASIAIDPFFSNELLNFDWAGPGKTLYANQSTIYLKYVSNGATFGLNLAMWPQAFANGVAHLLACNAAMGVTKSRDDESNERKAAEIDITRAKVRNAVDERVKPKPVGRLVRARFRNGSSSSRSLSDFT